MCITLTLSGDLRKISIPIKGIIKIKQDVNDTTSLVETEHVIYSVRESVEEIVNLVNQSEVLYGK